MATLQSLRNRKRAIREIARASGKTVGEAIADAIFVNTDAGMMDVPEYQDAVVASVVEAITAARLKFAADFPEDPASAWVFWHKAYRACSKRMGVTIDAMRALEDQPGGGPCLQ